MNNGWNYAHYTNFGTRIAPPYADGNGFIAYRAKVVERLKTGEDVRGATDGERWIARAEYNIEQRRVEP